MKKVLYKTTIILIAAVWIINGLFCKVLHMVPRHEEIVARILGHAHAGLLTKAIGILEVLMAVWIMSGITPRIIAVAQMVIIGVMNCIEFVYAPDLLLWGRLNAVFAFLFIVFIYFNEFKLHQQLTS